MDTSRKDYDTLYSPQGPGYPGLPIPAAAPRQRFLLRLSAAAFVVVPLVPIAILLWANTILLLTQLTSKVCSLLIPSVMASQAWVAAASWSRGQRGRMQHEKPTPLQLGKAMSVIGSGSLLALVGALTSQKSPRVAYNGSAFFPDNTGPNGRFGIFLCTRGVARAGRGDVYDTLDNEIATIPIGFLDGSGERSWRFVLEIIEDCITNAGHLRQDASKDIVSEHSSLPVIAGRYTFIRMDQPASVYRKGPEPKRPGRIVGESNDSSIMSNSKRSSVGQVGVKFRNQLVARDSVCLLTGAPFARSTSAHIVPISRKDLYPIILGRKINSCYEPWMGLLLRDDLHRAYDRYDFALYPKANEYVVHCFVGIIGQDVQALHGKAIPFDRFHYYPDWKPNAKLLRWQYRQCGQMHIRGSSYGVPPADAIKEMMDSRM
ncbi:MAG: hypothetical protein CYPHOPRED_001889 [Cyphobasidiales sp. Tagirdzhanova-0007]|nr:MAG: hypothetical protein CYPHOPRED_001889 [Cyphobasidiales sp. Tagirdzhanova-0007]